MNGKSGTFNLQCGLVLWGILLLAASTCKHARMFFLRANPLLTLAARAGLQRIRRLEGMLKSLDKVCRVLTTEERVLPGAFNVAAPAAAVHGIKKCDGVEDVPGSNQRMRLQRVCPSQRLVGLTEGRARC
jgi:hypothetical protein